MIRPIAILVFAACLSMGCSLALDFDAFRGESGVDGSLRDGSPPDGSRPDGGPADSSTDASFDAAPPCEASAETCNMLDDDCDGIADEGGYGGTDCADVCGEGPDGGEPVTCTSYDICIAGRCGERPFFVSAGAAHSCAATERTGRLYCWGSNSHGHAGGGGDDRVLEPSRVAMPAMNTRHVGAGAHHTCAVDYAFLQPLCWGDNSSGQLGSIARMHVLAPTPVPEVGGAHSAFGGGDTTCFVGAAPSGPLFCSGVNGSGQIGDGTTENHESFVSGAEGEPVSRYQVSMGASHMCAMGHDGETPALLCWGDNTHGQVGTSEPMSQSSPVVVPGTGAVASVAAGARHTCAVLGTGVSCWGHNDQGQLGIPMSGDSSSPAPVFIDPVSDETPVVVKVIAAGEAHSCAALEDGRLFCWGHNSHGQLGDGTRADQRDRPAQVAFRELDEVIALMAGDRHTCAGTARGLLFCWGDNTEGQLGIGVAGGVYTTPQRVSGVL